MVKNITGVELKRIVACAGYRGHGAPVSHNIVYTAGQERRMTDGMKRAIEIG